MSSPSSRRAWIEISSWRPPIPPTRVALLAEGVDRNKQKVAAKLTELKSPSSRRAWIEIEAARKRCTRRHVALLAEGVDRN